VEGEEDLVNFFNRDEEKSKQGGRQNQTRQSQEGELLEKSQRFAAIKQEIRLLHIEGRGCATTVKKKGETEASPQKCTMGRPHFFPRDWGKERCGQEFLEETRRTGERILAPRSSKEKRKASLARGAHKDGGRWRWKRAPKKCKNS